MPYFGILLAYLLLGHIVHRMVNKFCIVFIFDQSVPGHIGDCIEFIWGMNTDIVVSYKRMK